MKPANALTQDTTLSWVYFGMVDIAVRCIRFRFRLWSFSLLFISRAVAKNASRSHFFRGRQENKCRCEYVMSWTVKLKILVLLLILWLAAYILLVHHNSTINQHFFSIRTSRTSGRNIGFTIFIHETFPHFEYSWTHFMFLIICIRRGDWKVETNNGLDWARVYVVTKCIMYICNTSEFIYTLY